MASICKRLRCSTAHQEVCGLNPGITRSNTGSLEKTPFTIFHPLPSSHVIYIAGMALCVEVAASLVARHVARIHINSVTLFGCCLAFQDKNPPWTFMGFVYNSLSFMDLTLQSIGFSHLWQKYICHVSLGLSLFRHDMAYWQVGSNLILM